MVADNKSLGRFILDGIPPAPRGIPQIEVTFDIDANGILKVSAQDKATGREQSMQIVSSSGLADKEVERMVQEAEQYREQDQQRKEEIEARNMADNAVYSAEKFLREQQDKVPSHLRSETETKIEALKQALEGGDSSAIRQRTDELSQAMQQMGSAMYQETGSDAGPEGSPGTPPGSEPPESGDEDVIEGEFSET
jgi:molecular chaperone DnaK